jgi:transcriptional regulator with XRE-family HTH domain
MQGERSFGSRVKELRKAKNLSQRELADRVAARLKAEDGKGFDFTYLSKIENDRTDPPSTAVILQLAAELEADTDELLALANKPPSDLGKALTESETARQFFRSAVNLQLSEEEWKELLETLNRMRDDSNQ